MVEVTVALTVVTIAVYLLSSTITSVLTHAESKRERTLAIDAAMNQLEVMHSQPFADLFVLYNGTGSDDPGGAGTAPGKHFAVEGLSPWSTDPDGFAGEIVLPSSGKKLREDKVNPELSMPRDLSGDLRIDDADHSLDYIVLPVTVRVQWEGPSGQRWYEVSTMFAKMAKLDS